MSELYGTACTMARFMYYEGCTGRTASLYVSFFRWCTGSWSVRPWVYINRLIVQVKVSCHCTRLEALPENSCTSDFSSLSRCTPRVMVYIWHRAGCTLHLVQSHGATTVDKRWWLMAHGSGYVKVQYYWRVSAKACRWCKRSRSLAKSFYSIAEKRTDYGDYRF